MVSKTYEENDVTFAIRDAIEVLEEYQGMIENVDPRRAAILRTALEDAFALSLLIHSGKTL